MAIVAEWKIGNATILINDECFAKTKEEQQAVLDRVAEISGRIWREKLLREYALKEAEKNELPNLS